MFFFNFHKKCFFSSMTDSRLGLGIIHLIYNPAKEHVCACTKLSRANFSTFLRCD